MEPPETVTAFVLLERALRLFHPELDYGCGRGERDQLRRDIQAWLKQETLTMPVGAQIRALREANQITLRKFAESLGISATALSKFEREGSPEPDPNQATFICRR